MFLNSQIFMYSLSIIIVLLNPKPFKKYSARWTYVRAVSSLVFQAVEFNSGKRFFSNRKFGLINLCAIIVVGSLLVSANVFLLMKELEDEEKIQVHNSV